MAAKPPRIAVDDILGAHPTEKSVFSDWAHVGDRHTSELLPHRILAHSGAQETLPIEGLRQILVKHHASKEKLKRAASLRAILAKWGRHKTVRGLRLFPTNPNTQKGNLAECLLCEYVDATGKAKTLVYRLRHNPNVDQSMKGDDLLAFRFEEGSSGLIVGEAKFRAAADKAVVVALCDALARSQRGGLPISLQFVADRLFEAGQAALGKQVLDCALHFVEKTLVIDYAGLLLSDNKSASHVDRHASATTFRCAIISMSLADPAALVKNCFENLEEKYGFDTH